MRIYRPSIVQKKITLTETVLDDAVSALVDDTTALVDDTAANVGAQTVPSGGQPMRIVRVRPAAKIKARR